MSLVVGRCVPWSLRRSFASWREKALPTRCPALYQWLCFGRGASALKPVTHGPHHHFFGYYEKCPWNTSESLLLAHEAEFNDRPPTAKDSVRVGVVHVREGNRFETLAETQAWNWQQGAMLQWHPADPERCFVHNDRRDGRFIAVVRRIDGTEDRVYERPIYAMHPGGRLALGLNYSRLQRCRPGYGYAGVEDPWSGEPCPDDDGIYQMDLDSGASRLIISTAQLAQIHPLGSMNNAYHWINHIQISPEGNRFAFFHLWGEGKGETERGGRCYTADIDGSNLNCMMDAPVVSHYDWMDENRILMWAEPAGEKGNFFLCDIRDGSRQVVGEGKLMWDGHCSFGRDRQWILNDTYPDKNELQTLMLYHLEDGRRVDIDRLYAPKSKWWGEIRCDLHPRWSRSHNMVCIDSVQSGERQIYVADLRDYMRRETD